MQDLRRGIIYKIEHVSGKCYIGQTINTKFARWNDHERSLIRNAHHCQNLQDLWNESSIEDWNWSILDSNILQDNLNEREYFHHDITESNALNEATPASIKERTRMLVAEDLRSKELSYREIAKKHSVAVGTVGNINRIYVTG